jgi:hypothetical protein
MPDEAVSLRDINWRQTFPFTHLFRAFRIAVHPSKLILALLAIACLWCGGLVLDAIWARDYQVTPAEVTTLLLRESPNPMERALAQGFARNGLRTEARQERAQREGFLGIFHTFFAFEVRQANDVLTFGHASGSYNPFDSIWRFVVVVPLWLWSNHWLFALIYTAWFLLIWSVFGGAISRIAAVHVARDEKISVRHALSFSTSKVLSFIFAPVIPVLIVLGIGALIGVVSTILLHIPYVGPVIVGLLFFLALIGGFVITLVILGTIGGFNLMYPTVAVEGSDSFDAISRSFSYVFARPWRMLWYTIVTVIYGAICYLFVRFFIWLVLAATWFFMTWFLGAHNGGMQHPADVFPHMWPQPGLGIEGNTDPLNPLPYSPDYLSLKGTETVAAGLMVWWNYLIIGLIGAFAISFYFSANTIIYYLMRREVDATELDDVYVEDTDDELEEPAATTSAGSAPAAGAESPSVRVYPSPESSAPSATATDPSAGGSVPPVPPPADPPPA